MADIYYNIKENSISPIKGRDRFRNDYEYTDADDNYKVIKKKGNFVGLKLLNFLSDIELQGRVAEEAFKNLLDKNNVPCLYIGQGPAGIEYSEALKKTTKSKRPDFLINIPDIGVLFIDVKCRRRIGFSKDKNTYFQLFLSEIKALINLHKQLLIPVWIAFYDRDSVESQELKFYLISISMLKKYMDGVLEKLPQRERGLISSLRIPDELLYEIDETLIFKAGLSDIDSEIIEKFANQHLGLLRRIEDEIKALIRYEKVFKTKVGELVVKKIGENLCFKTEVDIVLKKMINERTVLHESKKHLTLLGE
ncbi:MAG: hypothetical protein ACOXZ9_03295 [Bacteroidales bacterium]|jgi:hypothetical protein